MIKSLMNVSQGPDDLLKQKTRLMKRIEQNKQESIELHLELKELNTKFEENCVHVYWKDTNELYEKHYYCVHCNKHSLSGR